MSKLRGVSTVSAGKATSLLDNLSGKMSEFQAAVNSQGLRYSFANIGDTQSVLGAVSKTADDIPRTGVKINFSEAGEVTGEISQAKKALQDALDKGPKAEVKSPTEQAKNWQGSGKYPGVDEFKEVILKTDDVYYRGEPNGSGFFTTKMQ